MHRSLDFSEQFPEYYDILQKYSESKMFNPQRGHRDQTMVVDDLMFDGFLQWKQMEGS